MSAFSLRTIISAPLGERRIDRSAREAFANALHDMLKQNKAMRGFTMREDTYISVRELVRIFFCFLLFERHVLDKVECWFS